VTAAGRRSVWILADQCHPESAHLRGCSPESTDVLFVVALDKLRAAPWHRQRLHLILATMRRFSIELADAGYRVDWRVASSMAAGVDAHIAAFAPEQLRVMRSSNRAGASLIARLAQRHGDLIDVVPDDRFLCSAEEFCAWADAHQRRDGSLLMEDFYRWQRRRLGILVDADGEPEGGVWNLDHENRLPPPRDGGTWPESPRSAPDAIDAEIAAFIDDVDGLTLTGAPWDGTWATDRAGALARVHHFIAHGLEGFGPYEDAIVSHHWHLNHSLISPYLNLGLLHPRDVVDAVLEAHRRGALPMNSVEGFIRQIIGWREYIHGVYWWRGADYASENFLDATDPLPPAFRGEPTDMNCVHHVAQWVHDYGWTHHIPRLMVLANLATLAGVDPAELLGWMHASFVDGADWVMVPNVIGMGTYADGGAMSTKPYVSGGNYISKMTDFCRGCAFDRSARVGDTACPFTTLYWDFLDRHRERLAGNHRMGRMYANLNRLGDIDEIRTRAVQVRSRLASGTL